MTDEKYIDIAIEISKNAKFPYGAIVVKDNKIIGRSDDETLISKSMYSHAELMAIESACKDNKNLYGQLKGATMYVSCEPCMMCMGAILYEQFDRLIYASTIEDSDNYICKEILCNTEELAKVANSKIEIVPELHRNIATQVLKEYEYKIKNRILITGAVLSSNNESVDTYNKIISWIDNDKYKISSPLDTMKFKGNDFERYDRAMQLLQDTKLIIAEMSNISTGQGMELQEATILNIPILVIAKKDSKISGLVKGCKCLKDIVYYEKIEDIKDNIIRFIEGDEQ